MKHALGQRRSNGVGRELWSQALRWQRWTLDSHQHPETAMRAPIEHQRSHCDPRLDMALRRIVLLGAALVLAVPAARGHSAWLGALPLWLLGMPLASWWALHRFRLPDWPRPAAAVARRRRSGTGQARRRGAGALLRGAGRLRAA